MAQQCRCRLDLPAVVDAHAGSAKLALASPLSYQILAPGKGLGVPWHCNARVSREGAASVER
jgi:hypothetical protein